MAAVPVTIIGTLTDSDGTKNVTLAGMAALSDVGVGGGPIMPGQPPSIWPGVPTHPIAPGGEPPSIWPSPGHPAHPIVIPPSIWPNPPEGQAPHPEHPIVIPHPPVIQGPDLQVKVVWTPENQWQVVLVPAGTTPAPSAAPAGRR